MSTKNDLTFSDLCVRYGTGRAYTISGTGRNRVTGYRSGMMCKAGDIESSEWRQMVKDLIDRTGEQELHQHLLDFMKKHYTHLKTKKDLEEEALKLHAARIFDNEAWVSYVKFNQQYRPEVLVPSHLRSVAADCCKTPGLVTLAMIKNHGEGEQTVPCPICGRFSSFVFADNVLDLLSA